MIKKMFPVKVEMILCVLCCIHSPCMVCAEEFEELWDEDGIEDDVNEEDSGPILEQERNEHPQASNLVMWIIAFLSFLQASYHLSNAVTGILVLFLKTLFGVLGQFCSVSMKMAELLPGSLYSLHKFTQLSATPFRRYVVCKKCHQIYHFQRCVDVGYKSKRCSYVAFPNHPHACRQAPCNVLLLKTVELQSRNKLLYPFKTYCYMSIESSLEQLLQRPNFPVLCEEWRHRITDPSIMKDIYDGQIWQDFMNFEGVPFLSERFSYGFMINVDWFQPYKHTQYSVGVIYFTLLNLPRHMRNKPENVMLVGVIPGPHEPSINLNSYIEPLVSELLSLWRGKELNIHGHSSKVVVRCALLCAACDLPAGRKLCGFMSYNAHYGCTRCWKKYSGSVGSFDYSGFDRQNWLHRSAEEHRETASTIRSCNTKAECARIESQSGYRYTSLLNLPYFDTVRMLVLDPMHNLFLGTAKHVLKKIWLDQGVLSPSEFSVVQSRIDKTVVPSDIGRIPYKIESGFSSFTADQFKNWVLHFSLLTLRDKLSDEHFQCWKHFVLACRILSSKAITLHNIKLADALLMQFCRRTERLYGKHVITPNMHLHAHIHLCLKDFGPLHGFWLFSFERFNGILGQQPNNNRSIEVQLMKRFLRDQSQTSVPLPSEFKDKFLPIFSHHQHLVGTLSEHKSIMKLPIPPLDVENVRTWDIESQCIFTISLPSHSFKAVFTTAEIGGLKMMYSRLYGVSPSDIDLNSVFIKYKMISLNSKTVGSHNSRCRSSSILMCLWHPVFCDWDYVPPAPCECVNQRPARINYFAKHTVSVQGVCYSHLLFSALWFKRHSMADAYGSPVSIWECDIFDLPAVSYIIPIQFVRCRTISLIDKLDDTYGTVLFISPCIDF